MAILIVWPGSVTYWLDKKPTVDPARSSSRFREGRRSTSAAAKLQLELGQVNRAKQKRPGFRRAVSFDAC